MSVFPGSLDSDATLYVAKDYIQTKLAAPQAVGDAIAVLASAAGWAPNMVLSVDVGKANVEQQLVTGVVGNVLNVTRGFGGTTPSAHVQNAVVSNNVDAAYQSAAKSAIIAIETALGANLANVGTMPAFNPSQYKFAPQTPVGPLSIGANTITFPNGIPPGITTDSVGNASLYISGGVGTAEAVPVIGVNVGANQVTVTCANTHSGAWTIQSATGGWQEAVIATAGRGRVWGGAGVVDLYAAINVPSTYSCSVRGMGIGVTVFEAHGTTGNWIYFKGGSGGAPYADVGDFSIVDSSNTMHGLGSMVRVSYKNQGCVSNIEVQNGYWGITAESCQKLTIYNCVAVAAAIPIYVTTLGVNYAGSGFIAYSNCQVVSCWGIVTGTTGAGIQVDGTTTGVQIIGCVGTATAANANNRALQFISNFSVGPLNEISVVGGIYDIGGCGIAVIGDGASFNTNFITFNGVEANGSEYGLFIDAKISNLKWNGGYIKAGTGVVQQPVFIRGAENIRLTDVDLDGLGTYTVTIDSTPDVLIDGVRIGRNGSVPTNGVVFATTTSTPNRIVIQNSDFGAIATPANRIVNPPVPTILTLANNIGIGSTVEANWAPTETGANNAIAAAVPGVPLVTGLIVRVLLAHTLQAGANTFNLNAGGAVNIKSSRNTANNIGTAYASGGTVTLLYDGTQWQDVSQ